MNDIITATDLSKMYTIRHEGKARYSSIRDEIAGFIKRPSSRYEKNESFWALKDVNFSVKQGETVGIIGSNGAGKSTLLKILSRIIPPTKGEIVLRGRVSSLLEVGTGFHPELTGRENIYLNAAVLGMTRKEITRKFDAIVDFAEVEKFLDTPIKHYSSGMYMRLAFSVAAHLEPEILIVDEVLAVGDAKFQKKCLGKMSEVSKQGRTVIFVSHNMAAINTLCSRTVLIENGTIKMDGKTNKVIAGYLSNTTNANKVDLTASHLRQNSLPNSIFAFTEISVRSIHKQNHLLETGQPFIIEITGKSKQQVDNIQYTLTISGTSGQPIYSSQISNKQLPSHGRNLRLVLTMDPNIFSPGIYSISISAVGDRTLDFIPYAMMLIIHEEADVQLEGVYDGVVVYPRKWNIIK